MRKLLTICIPTYKRAASLRRCIQSAVEQTQESSLWQDISIFVANDASPDETTSVLEAYRSLTFFSAISREHNLGMSANIRLMLAESSRNSEYQLIITDDDYLQPGALTDIIDFLRKQMKAGDRMSVTWTPRYSYTEDGKLHCVVCDTFGRDTLVRPSAANVGRYMANGFVLSGLILRGNRIDYGFWEQYEDNAFFPVIFVGDLLAKEGAYFWKKNIVHHTVLNKCHWERWGKNDVVIEMRLFLDFVNAYHILATKISNARKIRFYFSSFLSIYGSLNSLLRSDKIKTERSLVLDAIAELGSKRANKIDFPLRELVMVALATSALISATKTAILRIFSTLAASEADKKEHIRRRQAHASVLRATRLVFKLVTYR